MVMKRLVHVGLCIEGAFVLYCLIGGTRGALATYQIQQQNAFVSAQLVELQHEIDQVERELHDWRTYPWYREEYARTKLQMARPGDEIYLV